MSKSINVPAFPVNILRDALTKGATKVAAAEDAVVSAVGLVFTKFTDALITQGGIPNSSEGRNAIRKAVNIWRDDAEIVNVLESGMFGHRLKAETLTQYSTGVMLCYFAKREWYAGAAKTPEQGGVPRPQWWLEAEAKRSASVAAARAAKAAGKEKPAEPGKPGKPEVWSDPEIRKEASHLVRGIRALYGDRAGDAVLDALMTAIPKFRIEV